MATNSTLAVGNETTNESRQKKGDLDLVTEVEVGILRSEREHIQLPKCRLYSRIQTAPVAIEEGKGRNFRTNSGKRSVAFMAVWALAGRRGRTKEVALRRHVIQYGLPRSRK
ncbi:hypothetical protein CRG98_042654 [Punica granatum]|uniref:Uncharacterized protein n=1 Tax=Punica granatum TaxID=22663 RepID=A0A2I0HZD2_PUNGR|nr:hypothetical protein CRG98_042654 [Punica granatum]